MIVVRPGVAPDSMTAKALRHVVDTAKVAKNWNKLRKGQSQATVLKLLGSPGTAEYDGINGWAVWWYGRRNVAFNAITGKLSHWDKTLEH